MKDLGTKLLMALGFIAGGIGMARTMGDIPDDLRAIKEKLSEDKEGSSEEKAE